MLLTVQSFSIMQFIPVGGNCIYNTEEQKRADRFHKDCEHDGYVSGSKDNPSELCFIGEYAFYIKKITEKEIKELKIESIDPAQAYTTVPLGFFEGDFVKKAFKECKNEYGQPKTMRIELFPLYEREFDALRKLE
jgi:hypothetical protein